MALDEQVISVPFGKGLDTKTDKKAVVAGNMILLENATFTEANRIEKCPGFDALSNATFSPYTSTSGTLASPKMVKSFNNELVCAENTRLWSYSPSLTSWIDKGPYESIAVSQAPISAATAEGSQTYQSSAVLGNFTLLCWQMYNPGNNEIEAFAAVIDNTTGLKTMPDTSLGASPATGEPTPKVSVVGDGKLAVFYIDSANHLVGRLLTTAGGASVLGAPFTLATNIVRISDGFGDTAYQYDVVNTGSFGFGGVVAYYNGTTVTVKTFDQSLTVHTTNTTFTGVQTISITPDTATNGNIWVYGASTVGTTTTFKYIVFDAILGSILGTTVIDNLVGVTGNAPLAIYAVSGSPTQQTVIYNASDLSQAEDPFAPIHTKSVTSAGNVNAGTFTQAYLGIASKPFFIGNYKYVLAIRTSAGDVNLVNCLYLLNIDTHAIIGGSVTGAPVAKALWGQTVTTIPAGYYTNVNFLSPTKISINFPYLAETIIDGGSGTAPTLDTTQLIYSSTLLTFDFNHQDAYQGLSTNGQLILNGGLMSLYDGDVVAEAGFLDSPTVQTATANGNVGNVTITGGSVFYTAVFQWLDSLGNLHQSSQSLPRQMTNTTVNANTQVEVDIYCPLLTTKDPEQIESITVALYRTIQNGTLFFQVGHKAFPVAPGSANIVTFTDNISDANLVSGLPLYTTGNILPNDPPPPSMIFNNHNNRLFAVDSTNTNNIWYAKTNQEQVGISFSGDLVLEIDGKGGGIVATAELDDKEVLFKADSRIAIIFGDGANDTGTGATFSTPQFIQTDSSCQYSKSLISQPDGLMYRTAKGWYTLNRSLQVAYTGAQVEAYNNQDVTSAVRLNDKTQCRFTTSSGSTLIYDYFFKQWSVRTNATGYAADIFQGLYTYARTDGRVYQQNNTTFLDAGVAYQVRAQIAYIKLTTIQGFQRVRKVFLLGDHLSPVSGHGIKISAAYDFDTTFSTPIPFTFSSTGSFFQYREHLPRQKCDTISLLIEEVTTGASGEYIDLTDLSFEAGMKKGPQKLPATQSVG